MRQQSVSKRYCGEEVLLRKIHEHGAIHLDNIS